MFFSNISNNFLHSQKKSLWQLVFFVSEIVRPYLLKKTFPMLIKYIQKIRLSRIQLKFREISSWFLLETDFRFEFLVRKYTSCAENFKYIRQRERPLWLKHVHGHAQKLLNFKLTKYGLVFMKKFYSKNNLWLNICCSELDRKGDSTMT